MSIKIDILSAEISLRLTEERVRLGFSQADMARQLGVTRETMRKWEAGLSTVSADGLAAAFKLGADVQYILTGVRVDAKPQGLPAISTGNIKGMGPIVGNNVTIHHGPTITRAKVEVRPGVDHITDAQAATLSGLVQKIVDTEAKLKRDPKTHRAVWAALNKYCGVTQYRLIPLNYFEKAKSYLDVWMGRLNSAKSASVVDGDNWRKRRYAYIKINTKEPTEQAALAQFLLANYGQESLAELPNEALERVYRYVASRRMRRAKLAAH